MKKYLLKCENILIIYLSAVISIIYKVQDDYSKLLQKITLSMSSIYSTIN